MFEDSSDVPIPGKSRSTPHSGCSKPGGGPSSSTRITRSSARPRKENLCTGDSGGDDNNERTKSDEDHTPPSSQRLVIKVHNPKSLENMTNISD